MSAELKRSKGKLQVTTDIRDLEKCKQVPGGKWNKEAKCWEYPEEAIAGIMQVFKDIKIPATLSTWVTNYMYQRNAVVSLRNGKVKPREHKFLMLHQRICRDIACLSKRYAFFLDTGTGKTMTALSVIEENMNIKWLIICPKSIIKTAWVEDQAEWFPNIKLLPLSRNMKKADYTELSEKWDVKLSGRVTIDRLKVALAKVADAVIMNPECFKSDIEMLTELNIGGIVMDESSMIKNTQAQITKAVTKFADTMDRLYLLSGKPAPNSEIEYFPQIRIVNPSVFGTNFSRFKERYFDKCGYMGYDLRLKPRADEDIANRLAECSIVIKKEDCLDLPPKVYQRRMVELSPEARKYYKQMEKQQLLLIGDRSIEAAHKITARMKLRQITSGFIIDTANEKTDVLHHAKLNELEEVIGELGDNKAIIWINFKQEVREITALMERLGKTYTTAYSGSSNVDTSVRAFKDNEAQFIIAHPKTLKYGVTFTGTSMVKNCTYAIYYSMSDSFEDYYQSHDRIYRKGQTESCTFIFLMVENSVDIDMSTNVDNKQTRTEVIENFMRRASDGLSEDVVSDEEVYTE